MNTLLLLILLATPLTDADSALRAGRYPEAIRLYQQVLRTNRSSHDAQYGLARALAYSDSHAAAIDAYTVLIRRNANDVDARLGRGLVYAWDRNYAAAEADLGFVTRRSPRYVDAWLALGDMYRWSERPAAAIEAYTQVTKLAPAAPGGYLGRARAERVSGEFGAARADVARAAERGAANDDVAFEREAIRTAQLRLARGNSDTAGEAAFAEYLADYPADTVVRAELIAARAARDAAPVERAAEDRTAPVELAVAPAVPPPTVASAVDPIPVPPVNDAASTAVRVRSLLQRADAARTAGDHAGALSLYDEVIALAGSNLPAHFGRGLVRSWSRDYAGAVADLTMVTQQQPANSEAWLALGNAYWWSDQHPAAVTAYTGAIAAKNDDPDLYLARAKAARDAGDRELARADIERARALGTDEVKLAVLAGTLTRTPTSGGQTPDEFLWSASAGYSLSQFSPERRDWHEYGVTVRRHFDSGSLGVEWLHANRFALNDDAYALDAYLDLWSRAYVNARYQAAPHHSLYPRFAYRAELFQGFGQGWEASFSYDHMRFGRNSVDMYGPALGKYWGNWYFRWKTLIIPATARTSVSNRALARWYFMGNADDYFEVNGGFGRGGEYRRNSDIVEGTRSSSVGLALQKYFTEHWGIKVGAGYSDDKNSFVERDVSASVLMRW